MATPVTVRPGGLSGAGGNASLALRALTQPHYRSASFGSQQNKNRQAPKPQANHPPTGHAAPTDPLAPLSPGQIRQQATSTINKAYAPSFTDLGNQGSQAQNLYATQTADDKYFRAWLAGKSQELQGQIDTVNGKLGDVLTGIRANQANALGALPGALQGQVQGTGVAPGQLQQGLANETAGTIANANARVDNANAQGISNVQAANTGLFDMGAITQTQMSALQGRQLDQLDKTINSIAAERTKLLVSRTGDIAKEIARLNGVEISKAQFKVNQANLAAATGIKQQAVNVQKANALTNSTNATTRALQAQETARHNTAMEGITSTHYATQAQHDAAVAAETARHNKVTEGISQQNANTKGSAGKPPKLTNTQRLAVSGYINTLRNALIDDINKYHRGQPDALGKAYHDITSGRYYKATGNGIPAPPLGGDKFSYLNAATNTLTDYGASGLTPGDVSFLQSIGYGTGSYPVKMQNKGTNPRQDASGQTIGQ